ncbi:MAG TPA: cupredoxin family protein [Ideonella sp.]|nr:cupredoxin family protein [Ideonella sp.]
MKTRYPFQLAALALAASTSVAFAHGGEEHAVARKFDASQVERTDFGQEGNPKKVTRTIRVDMADSMRFTPADITVRRGETIKFVVRNGGKALHEMVLGTRQALAEHAELMKKFPEMEHADANMAHVKPGQAGEIIWQFTQAGEFQFACLQPGHFEAGMIGRLTVK